MTKNKYNNIQKNRGRSLEVLSNIPFNNYRIVAHVMHFMMTVLFLIFADWSKIKKMNSGVTAAGHRVTMPDLLFSCFRFGISPEEYHSYRFYKKNEKESAACVGSNFSFYLSYNKQFFNQEGQKVFLDKYLFYQKYEKFFGRKIIPLFSSQDLDVALEWAIQQEAFFIKSLFGYHGVGIERIKKKPDRDSIKNIFEEKLKQGESILEELIVQHSDTAIFNPSSVNTVLVNTIYVDGKMDVFATIFHMGCGDSGIDNFAAGGIAAPIDENGVVCGPGIKMFSLDDEQFYEHPVSKIKIPGYQIPFWKETIAMVEGLVEVIPGIKVAGWDIAITEKGPVLLEGNHPWTPAESLAPYQIGRLEKILPYLNRNLLLKVQKKYF